MPRGMIGEIVAGSFGIAAAILLVGGWILLRLARDRQHFRLMQIALDKGITSMPGLMPGWLLSLRQGVLAFVLGIGVAISGAVLNAAADHIDSLPANALLQPDDQPLPQPLPPRASPDQGPDQGPDRRQQGPHGMHNPQPFPGGASGPEGPGGPPQQRPPQNPAMERWHRIQTQRLIGGLAGLAGSILALLGIVRIAFSRIERKYAAEITGSLPTRTPQ